MWVVECGWKQSQMAWGLIPESQKNIVFSRDNNYRKVSSFLSRVHLPYSWQCRYFNNKSLAAASAAHLCAIAWYQNNKQRALLSSLKWRFINSFRHNLIWKMVNTGQSVLLRDFSHEVNFYQIANINLILFLLPLVFFYYPWVFLHYTSSPHLEVSFLALFKGILEAYQE